MKRLTSIIVYILAILSAELMIEYSKHYIHFNSGSKSPYYNTLIGMAIIVAIFYPLMLLADWLFEKITESLIGKSKDMMGSSFLGLLISFTIGFSILFLIYLKEWYGKTLW